jgi:hypothetical protein
LPEICEYVPFANTPGIHLIVIGTMTSETVCPERIESRADAGSIAAGTNCA